MLITTIFLALMAPSTRASELEETIQVPGVRPFRVQLEAAGLWQTRNAFRLPGNSGTAIDLSDTKRGPFFAARLSAEWRINPNHGLKLLIAPLSLEVAYTPGQAVSIAGQTYAAGTPLTTRYKFNSYRLTYRYFFDSEGPWKFRLGLTAKIRDATISTTDGVVTGADPNLGFVPLIHFGVRYEFTPAWFADFDMDALAAPQGRAEDLALRVGYDFTPWEFSLGYRLLEGGADNDRVYTFAFFHYAFVSAAFDF